MRLEELIEDRTVYHGTAQDFAAFDDTKRGASTGHVSALLGHFVTLDPRHAGQYPMDARQKRVMTLRLQRGRYYRLPINRYYDLFSRDTSPETVHDFRAQLQSKGYDGIRIVRPDADFPQVFLRRPYTEVGTFIVFDPSHLRLKEANELLRIHRNPSPAAFIAILNKTGELRGTINGPDVWLWSAFDATHGEIDNRVGVDKSLGVVDLRIYRKDVPVQSVPWSKAMVQADAFKWGAYLRAAPAGETELWNQFPRGRAIAESNPIFARYLALPA